jgi:tRNA threonylcarbamoyladenosine biosynthesis protein TsaB
MLVLALDTTTRGGSVALVESDRVIGERGGDPERPHAERLPRELQALLDAHGRKTSDIDVFAVGSGPGSFTGLRVGIATLQGLAFVHRRPLTGVSALEALAHIAALNVAPGALVGAWMDAHRRDVFSALYRVVGGTAFVPEYLREVEGPRVDDPVATLERWNSLARGEPIEFIGDGVGAWIVPLRLRYPSASLAGHPLLAGAIGRIAAAMAHAGRLGDPSAVRPLYVRRPDAIIDRERRAFSEGRNN